jgi:hypothetical protein
MRLHHPILGFLAASLGALALGACSAAHTEIAGAGLLAADASASDAAGADASADDASAACNALETEAEQLLASAAKGLLACQVDSDCVWAPVNQDGLCAAPCGGLTSKASETSFVAAAASACQQFDALGCAAPEIPCVAAAPSLCAAGTCAPYAIFLSGPSSPITHGECAEFQLAYGAAPGSPANAPHDVAVPVTVTSGTLYADATCGTPLAGGTVTIPGGTQGVGFGFEAQAAGSFSLSAGRESGSFVVQ